KTTTSSRQTATTASAATPRARLTKSSAKWPSPPASPRATAPPSKPTAPSAVTRPRALKTRRLQFVLRDGATIEGTVRAGGDQSLVAFLNTRSGWMNVTDATRVGSGEPPGHMILQTDHVVMAIALDGDVGVSTSASGAG